MLSVNKERKKMFYFFCIFVDLERQSFAYVPERDQNHVVRGKNPSDLFDWFQNLKMILKEKSQSGKKVNLI